LYSKHPRAKHSLLACSQAKQKMILTKARHLALRIRKRKLLSLKPSM
jgi:hypothetical protein